MAKETFRILPFKDPKRPNQKWQVVYYTPEGVRKRPTFSTKGEAQLFKGEREAEVMNIGFLAMGMTHEQRREAAECFKLLEKSGRSLKDAVTHFLKHLETVERSCTIKDAIEAFLEGKRRAGKSSRYLLDLKSRLGFFEQEFGERVMATVSTREIDTWLSNMVVGGQTRNNTRRVVGTLFSYGVAHGYAQSNPVDKVAIVKVVRGDVGILSPKDMGSILAVTKKEFAAYLPGILVQGFAGVRTHEMLRMRWQNINWETGSIVIGKKDSKTAQRRIIKMQPNLLKWLHTCRSESAERIVPADYDHVLADIRKRVANPPENTEGKPGRDAVTWPDNALRHSFATYHYAKFQDAGKTAADLGQQSSTMLFKHYRELVSKEQAERWWAIKPF